MTNEMTLQQAMDMANSAHASKQEKVLAAEVKRLWKLWYLRGDVLEQIAKKAQEAISATMNK